MLSVGFEPTHQAVKLVNLLKIKKAYLNQCADLDFFSYPRMGDSSEYVTSKLSNLVTEEKNEEKTRAQASNYKTYYLCFILLGQESNL